MSAAARGETWANVAAPLVFLGAPKGERHTCAKLTEIDVREIRSRAACGESTMVLARAFGVSHGAIWHIVHRRTWRHVA